MVEFHESKVRALTPAPDGALVTFQTPTKYVPGSFRLVVNGSIYEPDDEAFGWVELANEIQITITTAPRVGDVLQGFYQDQDAAGQLGLDDVKGSPFHPTNLYP